MPDLVPVLTEKTISRMVATLAREISSDYQGKTPVAICVLKGAFVFLADLIRNLTIPVQIDFVRLASYGADTTSSEQIHLTKAPEMELAGRDVIVVEDIIDTGLTICYLIDYLQALEPGSVKVCALIDKTERRRVDFQPDYVCHEVKQGFMVGYGLDHAELYRNLPGIYHLKF